MTSSRTRDADRTALVAAIIGDPADLPSPRDVDLTTFWARFDETAPAHLALGLRTATVAIAVVLPRLLGHAQGLRALGPDAADAVVQRAAALPGFAVLTEMAKVVACLAYYSDAEVQALTRSTR